MYSAYITTLKEVRPHSNADRLQLATCFGNQIVVDLTYKEGDVGVYFPSGGKLGKEFAEENNLLRKKDEQGNNIGGFINPVKRNIKAIRLRGEQSDGLFLPLSSLAKFTDTTKLKEGDEINILNKVVICEKYIPQRNNRSKSGNKGTNNTNKSSLQKKYPFFEQHADTKQMRFCMNDFRPGDICTLTLKMHGTSARTAYTIAETEVKRNFLQKIFYRNPRFKTAWETVSGTRRVTLDFTSKSENEDDNFRKKWHDIIAPKLRKGEEIFYELVGYVDEDTLIMPQGKNSKVGDAEFIKRYGEITEFTYGCKPGECKAFVYRMIMTNEDGESVEYSDWFMRLRCEQMGLQCVPKFEDFIYTDADDLLQRVNKYVDGPDPIGKTHIREGVVVRIQNREKFKALKEKNFNFKVIEDIIKDTTGVPDMEEAQEAI